MNAATLLTVSTALREELLALVTAGDSKANGALTPGVLRKIAALAGGGRQAMISLAGASDLPTAFPGAIGGMEMGSNGDEPNENFASRTLRELATMIPEWLRGQNESPEKMVCAIKDATDAGLTDVAEALKARLLGRPRALPVLPALAEPDDETAEIG